jgi:hypothetical protein
MHGLKRLLLLLVLGTVVCSAQKQRQNEPYCDEHAAKKADITEADATIRGFAIGHASLKDVQTKLGNAEIVRASRDEESDVLVCYTSPADGTVLAFYSGAMGGWEDITYFAIWSREAAFPDALRCTPSAGVSRRLATDSGLRLGLTAAEVKAIAGKPTRSSRTLVKYDYDCRRKMTNKEIIGFKTSNNWDVRSDPYFDRMSWIEVSFTNSTASRIEIGRTESY